MNKELISVIVPVYNVEQYMRKCINSIIKQTYEDIEIILVDDGSKDRSPQICDEYAKLDDRVHVIHKTNGGLSDARNAGLNQAKGKYLLFVDSDDYIEKVMIEKLYSALVRDKADISVCNYKLVDDLGNDIKEENYFCQDDFVCDEEIFWEEYYKSAAAYYIVAWNKLYKRELFYNERYDVGKVHEDEYICHRLISQCNRISCINESLYYYVQREGSIMNSEQADKKFDVIEALIKRSLYFKENAKQTLAETALLNTIIYFIGIKSHISKMDSSIKKRIKKGKKLYRKAYIKVVKGGASIKFILHGLSFFIGERTYEALHFYRKLRK